MGKIRVLIADDQRLMRDGLRTILELEDDLEVVGAAADGLEAYEMTAALRPDVVLMDVRMPVMDGVESTLRIRREFPGTQVLILTTFDEDEYIIDALANGAVGYLLKDMPGEQLVRAVREGARGATILPSPVAAKLAARLAGGSEALRRDQAERRRRAGNQSAETPRRGGKRPQGTEPPRFTAREQEIAALMVRHYTNKEIAGALGITEGTLKNYLTSIYDKIGTNERLKAVAYLRRFIRVD